MIPGIGLTVAKLKTTNLAAGLTNAFRFEGDLYDYVGGNYPNYESAAYNNIQNKKDYYANFWDTSHYATYPGAYGGFQAANCSLSFWVRVNGNGPLIYNTGPSGYGFYINVGTTAIQVVCHTSSGQKFLQGTITSGTWYHIGLTMTSNSMMKLYVNSSLAGEIAMGNRILSSALAIKRDLGYGTGGAFWLDELYLWNRELTAAEITALYSGGGGLFYPNF